MDSIRRTETSVNLGLLILRVALGVTFVLHGWQKFTEWTLRGTAANFASMGVPLAEFFGPATAFVELLGGTAMILGLFSRAAGVLLAGVMGGAIVFVHGAKGFAVANGGFEFVLILGAAALTIALTGPGRYSVAAALPSRGRARMMS